MPVEDWWDGNLWPGFNEDCSVEGEVLMTGWRGRRGGELDSLYIIIILVRGDLSFHINNCKPLSQSGIFKSKQACFTAPWLRKAVALTRQRTAIMAMTRSSDGMHPGKTSSCMLIHIY